MALSSNMARFGFEADDVNKVLGKLMALRAPPALMGIDPAQWAGANAVQRLEMVAQGTRALGDANLQAGESIGLFAKLGMRMLPVLQQGGEGIAAWHKKQVALGAA